jgi:hypothetical protein
MDVEHLRALSCLGPVPYWYQGDPNDDADHSGMRQADCSNMNKRAKDELTRRGLT